MRRPIVLFTLALITVAGCSSQSSFSPSPPSEAVRAQEARLAELVERDQRAAFSGMSGTCKVRLLGTEGSSSFVWAQCDYPGSDGGPGGAVSVPVRVDGSHVQVPRDGDAFAPDVRRMFPSAMVSTILHDPDRLRPQS